MSCPSVSPTANSTTSPAFPVDGASQAPMENRASSPWAKMFHGGASPEELTQFINGFLEFNYQPRFRGWYQEFKFGK